jgi:hypothetical protein
LPGGEIDSVVSKARAASTESSYRVERRIMEEICFMSGPGAISP